MPFSALGLSKDLISAVQFSGYTAPTEVQAKVIPYILKGRDVAAESNTGTGKTAAFALPVIQLLQKSETAQETGKLRVLVLAPTRELALQTATAFKVYGRQLPKPPRIIVLVGGGSISLQVRGLHHGADIAVATPGRLLDLVRRNEILLSALKVLVIDEADKMLDLGFAGELDQVLKTLPEKRQNLLFSATIPDKINVLIEKFLHDPVRIKFDTAAPTVETVCQRLIAVDHTNRGPLLRHLIKTEGWEQVLVFAASIRGANAIALKLFNAGIAADAFHGDLTQARRGMILADFKNKKIQVLVATDLAARGINIANLPYVVNYDLPRSPDDYIHRIGRTARAGVKGTAVTFAGHEDMAHFAFIEKRTNIMLMRESVPGFELTGEAPVPEKGKAPVKGHRMSKKDKARALARQNNLNL
jgi:superfamily II DNA/RNA helicase